jgi:tol-pal system protein YbgF
MNVELSSLRNRVDELHKNQDTTIRELARTVSELKDLQSSLAKVQRSAEDPTRQLALLSGRVEETESRLKSLRESVEELKQEVVKRPASLPAVPEKVREAVPEKPMARSNATDQRSPEQMYQTALTSYGSRELGQAVLDFTELVARYPRHPLAGSAQYWIGEAYYAQRDYRQALTEFQKAIAQFPRGNKAPDVLLKVGLCYSALREPGRAQEAWERLIQEYPGSESGKRARKLLDSGLSAAQAAR